MSSLGDSVEKDEKIYQLSSPELADINKENRYEALKALEGGKVLYLPAYYFSPTAKERALMDVSLLAGKHKNLSFDVTTKALRGLQKEQMTLNAPLSAFMNRYAHFSKYLVDFLLPQYSAFLQWGRTSYRPAEIEGRALSKRKDDRRLHVDAFPSTPLNGLRLLRVFCNIHPEGQPRLWHLGEPYSQVLARFLKKAPTYSKGLAYLLRSLRVTRALRSEHDHIQLHLHDTMKLDDCYQKEVEKYPFSFPAQSTWLVFTDQVSHAALSGKFLLEQTFYLPIEAMAEIQSAPLMQWQRAKEELTLA